MNGKCHAYCNILRYIAIYCNILRYYSGNLTLKRGSWRWKQKNDVIPHKRQPLLEIYCISSHVKKNPFLIIENLCIWNTLSLSSRSVFVFHFRIFSASWCNLLWRADNLSVVWVVSRSESRSSRENVKCSGNDFIIILNQYSNFQPVRWNILISDFNNQKLFEMFVVH